MMNPLVFESEVLSCRKATHTCKCGNYGHAEKKCLCNPFQIKKYQARISGPLLDRIDIHLEIPSLKVSELINDSAVPGESSANIRERVIEARKKQKDRFAGTKIHCNAQMSSRHLKKYCCLNPENKDLMRAAIGKFGFSGRAYDRILKVSRTIADLEGSPEIKKTHIAEAINYRHMDRDG